MFIDNIWYAAAWRSEVHAGRPVALTVSQPTYRIVSSRQRPEQ